VTRGDTVFLNIVAENNGEPYTFQPGEVVYFKVFAKKDCRDVVLRKGFPIVDYAQNVEIILDSSDTKMGEVISKPRDLWYEIELESFGSVMTIVGYDEDGAKVFKLFPGGDDIQEYVPEPRVIKAIDDEFDMTSPRPVQNQVVARAFANLEERYENTHEAVAALHVTPEMFGASTSHADNHAHIISALDYLQSKGGGTLRFSAGVYKTSPISLQGYSNIILTGVEPSLPWGTASGLQIISEGSVGLQLSEESGLGYANEVPTWRATQIHIEHLRIDCNKMVNTGLNCNYGAFLRDVTVDNAKRDGIVFEPQTYPVILEQVSVRFSGRHGVYVKAPYSTVYNMKDCEFSRNDGYGLYIEDGNTCLFTNVLLQSNKRGGLKIEKKDPSLFSHDIFLGTMTFINVYTEANGTLATTDPDYDGNYAIYITNHNVERHLNADKIFGLTFINCSFNASKTGSQGLIEGVADEFTVIGRQFQTGVIDTDKCGTLFATGSNSTLDKINSDNPIYEVCEVPYYDESRKIRSFVGDGYIGKRGRMREMHFYLPKETIKAGETHMMQTVNPVNFYPILQTGTLYGINILQGTKPAAGSLTFKIKYGYKTGAGSFLGYLNIDDELKIDATKNHKSVTFPLLKYIVDHSLTIGIEVTASADYVPPSSVGYTYTICELFVES
jgi:hypothetical protein